MTEHPNATLLRGLIDAFATGESRAEERALADDVVWHAGTNRFSGRFEGRDGVVAVEAMQEPASSRASTSTMWWPTTSTRSRSSTSTSRSPTGADTTSSRSRSPTCATADRRVLDDEPGPGRDRPADRALTCGSSVARRRASRSSAGPRPADHRERRLRRGVAGRGPLVLGSSSPTRSSTRSSGRASGRSRRRRPRRRRSSGDGRRRLGRRRRPDVHVPRRVVDQVGRFLLESLGEVTVACGGDYFIKAKKRLKLAVKRHGGAPITVALEPDRAAWASRRPSDAVGGPVPTGSR